MEGSEEHAIHVPEAGGDFRSGRQARSAIHQQSFSAVSERVHAATIADPAKAWHEALPSRLVIHIISGTELQLERDLPAPTGIVRRSGQKMNFSANWMLRGVLPWLAITPNCGLPNDMFG